MNTQTDRKSARGRAAVARSRVATLVTSVHGRTPARVNAQGSPASIQPPPGTVTLPLAEYNRLLDRIVGHHRRTRAIRRCRR